jgi:hypothetical protein
VRKFAAAHPIEALLEPTYEVGRAAQVFGFFAGEALRISGEKFASVRRIVERGLAF